MASNPDIAVLGLFWYWISEREIIRKKKEAGDPKPWSEDNILNYYHFCNVRREDDRGTKELRAVVRDAKVDYWDLPWVYTAARMFNSARTLKALIETGWNWEMLKELRKIHTIFHTAYVVSTCGDSIDKVDYVHGVVRSVSRRHVDPNSLKRAHADLMMVNGLGSFLAGQVVADLKNHCYLESAEDWKTWSCIGPGSKKGLQYIFPKAKVSDKTYQHLINELQRMMPSHIQEMDIHAQDLQNCLCEFSKYMRLMKDDPGRRRPYHGGKIYVHN